MNAIKKTRRKLRENVVALPGIDMGEPVDVMPPADISPEALAWWHKLAPNVIERGHLHAGNVHTFAEYCDAKARLAEVEKLIGKNIEVAGDRGQRVKNPHFTTMKMYRDACIKYATLFGMTPLALASLPKVERPKKPAWQKEKAAK